MKLVTILIASTILSGCASQRFATYAQDTSVVPVANLDLQASEKLTPDNTASLAAMSVIGRRVCNLHGNNYSPALAMAKLGHSVGDYMPYGKYAPLVDTKIKAGLDWIKSVGKEKGCPMIHASLIKFLPDVYQ